MNIKAHRPGLLCLLLLALFLLAGASQGQETRKQLEERISKLRAEEQNLEEYRAELQHDLRELDDDESGSSQYVVVTARRPGIFEERGMYALMPKEAWANMIALEVLLGNKTPLEAAVRTRHILSETKAFPREARKKIVEIGQELEGIKQELSALEARLGRLMAGNSQRPGSASQFTVEHNIRRRSGLSQTIQLDSPEPKLCQDECAKDPSCYAYTYIKPGYEISLAACVLIYGHSSPEKCEFCTSGVKKQPL